MTAEQLEQTVLTKLRALPVDKQQEVLDFVEFLEQKIEAKRPRRSLKGLWADLGIDITEEDIAQARREMWGTFHERTSDGCGCCRHTFSDLVSACIREAVTKRAGCI
jgi:hypothetical protein